MAYQTGAATDLDDLFSKLDTFVAANGWTVDRVYNAGSPYTKMPSYHKLSCYVQFRYDGSSPAAEGRSCGIYQSTGFSGTQKSGNHPGDSGNGYYTAGTPADTSIQNDRCIRGIGEGPFTYHFFERDDGSGDTFYVHVAVEISQANWRHFGFGLIDKFGDWDTGGGGEYVYGQWMDPNGYSNSDVTFGLDAGMQLANTTGYNRCATMRVTTFPGSEQPTATWAAVHGVANPASTSNRDRANAQRNTVIPGMRSGPFSRPLGIFRGYPGFTGMVPVVPVGCWMTNSTVGVKHIFFIGWQADVRFCNIGDFEDGEEITIGSDTWIFFPLQKKSVVTADGSVYGGIAYRKDTT